ncbi:il-1/tlr signaling inhibitor [Raccoonpox virus]|uniref:Toll/IL1-receptor [TIR]-like protein n=1 Tax=Raccoon poxvirus TaxID=10256 RepID=A0A0G3G2Q8_RACVI|nr:Toll/IL1-receptor [TIR]-like protein [Raccoonpox virus]AKJ93797.1 Toll/IL1-receptor [TIR]-like protein [Raccoonpox virus]AOP31429.1 il-1/tlr signaling inhibitor [Raccoonpox virus]
MAFDVSFDASKTINTLVYFSSQKNKLIIQNNVNDTLYSIEFDKDQVVDSLISYNRNNDMIEIRGVVPDKTNIRCGINDPITMKHLYNKHMFKDVISDYIKNRNTITGNIFTALMTLDEIAINIYGDIDVLFRDKINVDSDSGLFNFVKFIKDIIIGDSRIVIALSSLVSKHWAMTDKKYRCLALSEYIVDIIPNSEICRLRYNVCKYLNGYTDTIEDEFDYSDDESSSSSTWSIITTDRETDV